MCTYVNAEAPLEYSKVGERAGWEVKVVQVSARQGSGGADRQVGMVCGVTKQTVDGRCGSNERTPRVSSAGLDGWM